MKYYLENLVLSDFRCKKKDNCHSHLGLTKGDLEPSLSAREDFNWAILERTKFSDLDGHASNIW